MSLPSAPRNSRPTWVEVDLDRLEANYVALRHLVTHRVGILAVIKADAYGHGAVSVAKRLVQAGVDALGVALPEEAVCLRDADINIPIVVLNGFWPGQEEQIIQRNVTPAVFLPERLSLLETTSAKMQRQVAFHLKVNTGMSRLGIDWSDAATLLQQCARNSWAKCSGIFTHLSSAENARSSSTPVQLKRFEHVLSSAEATGVRPHSCHAANSAALFNFRNSWLDCVRPGLALYGINPLPEPLSQVDLLPVLSFKTCVLQVRRVERGQPIGYGDSYSTVRDSTIATLPVGYADGLMRALSNRGQVLIRGHRCPIVGKISMDLAMTDVTEVPNISVGDEVVLIGRQGGQEIRVEELARQAETIPYEIVSRIGPRVPRIYMGASVQGRPS